jgi:hypothetical protein
VGRGPQTRSTAGITPFLEYKGYLIAKIHIVGHSGIGAVRVYGIDEGNNQFSLVHFEHSSEHDDRYLQKVSRITVEKFLNQTWQ